MSRLAKAVALFCALSTAPLASASLVLCTATCVIDSSARERQISVQGEGLDIQDALKELKKSCDDESKTAKGTSHFLATSFNMPNAPKYTATQTEFNAQKACQ